MNTEIDAKEANTKRPAPRALSFTHIAAIAVLAHFALGLAAIFYGRRVSAEVTKEGAMRFQVEPVNVER